MYELQCERPLSGLWVRAVSKGCGLLLSAVRVQDAWPTPIRKSRTNYPRGAALSVDWSARISPWSYICATRLLAASAGGSLPRRPRKYMLKNHCFSILLQLSQKLWWKQMLSYHHSCTANRGESWQRDVQRGAEDSSLLAYCCLCFNLWDIFMQSQVWVMQYFEKQLLQCCM